MRYGLIGGSGSVGQELVPVLKSRNHTVLVLGRDVAKLQDLYGTEVECEKFDVNDKSQTGDVLKGVDIVVYLVGTPQTEYKLISGQVSVALRAVKAAGVHRFILASSNYSYGVPKTSSVNELHPREPKAFKGKQRKEQEDVVLAAQGPDLEVLIIRSPDYYGPTLEQGYFKDVFVAALEDRRANVVAPVDTPHELIFIPDVARAISQLSEVPAAYGQALNITGPKPVTTQDFADRVFGQVGRQTKLLKGTKLMIRAQGWRDPVYAEIVEMHYLWTSPVLIDDSKARSLIPNWHKTPLDEGIKVTLAGQKEALDKQKK